MKKYLIVLFILAILISGFYAIFAQETQKIPSDFFIGKWGGVISGKIKHEEHNFPFDLELIGNPGKNTAYLKLNAVRIIDVDGGEALVPITVFDTQAPCAIYFKSNSQIFTLNFSQDLIKRISSDFNTWPIYQLALITGFKMEPINEKLFFLYSRENTLIWKGGDATGELHSHYRKKCEKRDKLPIEKIIGLKGNNKTEILPNGTQITKFNEQIKIVTEGGCVEIFITEYSKIIASDGTVMTILTRKILDGVISSHLYRGIIQVKKTEDGKPDIYTTKNAIVEVSGTNFTLEADGDGTTTLTVIDGEVEFSDKEKKKTVIVKNSQRSVCQPEGLPSDPVSIDSNMILRWWE